MPSDSENRRSVRFAESVDPDSEVELSKVIEKPATVEQLDVRIYRGAELDLRVKPYVRREDQRHPLVEYHGKSFIDGDSDHWTFPVSESVEKDDEIGVVIENTSSTADGYVLDGAVDLTLDRAGGSSRIFDAIAGWF